MTSCMHGKGIYTFKSGSKYVGNFAKNKPNGLGLFRYEDGQSYEGEFQDVVFSSNQNESIRRMISSLLAGYAWDDQNPIHKNAKRRLGTLAEYCREGLAQEQALEI